MTLDAVVIVVLILEVVSFKTKFSYVKVFRVLRLGKVVQAVRFAFFLKSLHKMLVSLASCVLSLLWAALLCFIFMYVAGLLMIQGITSYIEDSVLEAGRSSLWLGKMEDLNKLYGSFWQVVLTLFRAISGGGDWSQFAEPLAPVGPLYIGLWIAYIGFMTFGMLNVITGIFVQNVAMSEQDKNVAQADQLAKQDQLRRAIGKVFSEHDTDHNGFLSEHEFDRILDDRKALAEFAALGIQTRRLKPMFSALDKKKYGRVSLEEIIEGCFDLQAEVKAFEVLQVHENCLRLERGMRSLLVAGREAEADRKKRLEDMSKQLNTLVNRRRRHDDSDDDDHRFAPVRRY